MKIAFRADGSPTIGSGHMQRCRTIAEALTARGDECAFLCNEETRNFMSGFPYEILPEDTEQLCDWLVVDHYGLDTDYESNAREWAGNIAVIDDLANRAHDCDALFDITYGRDIADYQSLVSEGCAIFCGSEYAPLRPQFAELRTDTLARRVEENEIRSVLIFFSAADFSALTGKALEALESAFDASLTINLIGRNTLDFESAKHEIIRHSYVEDMASLMASCDLAIGGGGTTSWERCSLGLPAIIAVLADNQEKIAQELHKAGAVFNLGWYKDVGVGDIISALKSLNLQEMSQKSSSICDGAGVQRITEVLK